MIFCVMATACVTKNKKDLNRSASQAIEAQQRMDDAFTKALNDRGANATTIGQTRDYQNRADLVVYVLAASTKPDRPAWVNKPDAVYNKNQYLSAVGHGNSRRQAESNAYVNLTGLFGQSVKSNIQSVETYRENIQNGIVDISDSQEVLESIELSSSMDSLVGAAIDAVWLDETQRIYYAVAIMEKTKCREIYASLLDANNALIQKLTNLSGADKMSFDAIEKYNLAANIADANGVFATVLQFLGGSPNTTGAKTGEDYRYEADAIAKNIPINVKVDSDSGGRIKTAFASVFSGKGFRTGQANSRYLLDVHVQLNPASFPENDFKFTRYIIDANLTDTKNNLVLFAFNITDREGAATQL
jgi:hypothetical protein